MRHPRVGPLKELYRRVVGDFLEHALVDEVGVDLLFLRAHLIEPACLDAHALLFLIAFEQPRQHALLTFLEGDARFERDGP